jgi:cytochrome c oxidase cbb3-type subunit 3
MDNQDQNKTNKKQDEALLLNHNYDGIQEYDNPLPNWWLMTFFAAIIFSFVYWVHYEFGGGWTQIQEVTAHLEEIKSRAATQPGGGGGQESEEQLAALFGDQKLMTVGAEQFGAKCASCHGLNGEGLIGPNLTDNFFLHGNTRKEVMAVIRKGVLEKGMPAWEQMMKGDEVLAVSAYVYSMIGRNVPGKAAQGTEIK